MKINGLLILSLLVVGVNSARGMAWEGAYHGEGKAITVHGKPILLTQPLRDIMKAIRGRKLGAFFTCLENQDHEWLNANKELIKDLIEQDRLFMLGINTANKHITQITAVQRTWCKVHELMVAGLGLDARGMSVVEL